MTATTESLFLAAMALDADARQDLAERLWEAVQPQAEEVLSEATWLEIGRRVALSDAGLAEHIPGADSLAQVRAKFSTVVQ